MADRDHFQKSQNEFSKQRYSVWLEQAKYDLSTATHTIKFAGYEWVCYQSIQCVEKALKAVIVYSGYRAPKTHKLGVLISMCNRANPSFQNIKLNFRKIEGYTFISRYPFVIPGQNITPHELISKNDAETCLKIADTILKQIIDFLKDTKTVHAYTDISMDDYYFTPEEVSLRKAEIVGIAKTSEEMLIHKVILFGGFARENVQPRSSTMDILVIAETNKPFIERIQYFREITKGSELIVEPLVYTPDEFKIMLEEQGEGFLESAIEEGEVLYERSAESLNGQQ